MFREGNNKFRKSVSIINLYAIVIFKIYFTY